MALVGFTQEGNEQLAIGFCVLAASILPNSNNKPKGLIERGPACLRRVLFCSAVEGSFIRFEVHWVAARTARGRVLPHGAWPRADDNLRWPEAAPTGG